MTLFDLVCPDKALRLGCLQCSKPQPARPDPGMPERKGIAPPSDHVCAPALSDERPRPPLRPDPMVLHEEPWGPWVAAGMILGCLAIPAIGVAYALGVLL